MAQDGKRGLFASVFGSKKKTEEELEAEREFHLKLENRIREVLILADPPKLESVQQSERAAEVEALTVFPSVPSAPTEEMDYSYLHPSTLPEFPRKSPSRYRPAFERLEPARAARAR